MLKFFVLALLALHCNCQDVIEVNGNKIVTTHATHLPVKTVSGIHQTVAGLPALRQALPLSSYYSGLPAVNYGLNINGVNLGYLNGVGGSVLQPAFGVAPQVYSYAPQQSLLAIRQPAIQQLAIQHVSQPAVAVARQAIQISQPAVHIAQPAATLIAQPQVYSTEAVRPVAAAIQQVGRTVEYRDVPNIEGPIVPQEVVVEPSDQPINILFRSRSSTVRIAQQHIPGEPGTIEHTHSEDEPSKVIHEVVKPVIQEVREVIQPYRQITQEVQPVVENVHRVVSSGQRRQEYVEQPVVRQVAAVQAVREVEPVAYAAAKPAIAVAQRAISVAQPVSQIQTLAVQNKGYAIHNGFQPIVSSIVRTPYIYGSDHPIIGVNPLVAQQVPVAVQQEEARLPIVRQVIRPERQRDNGNNFVKYAETE